MKNYLSLILFLVSISIYSQKDILFIGNSLTYFNNMPQTFEAIANSKGDATAVTSYTVGGAGFVDHVENENVYDKFREKEWDYVVLQPGAGESVGSTYIIDETLERAKRLQDSIIKYSPCAKILYYEISWGVYGTSDDQLEMYNNAMGFIRPNIEFLSDETELFFAPVGEAFSTSWNNDLTDMLWINYGDIHPNEKGSYIAACVFYASIFQKNSLGATFYDSLSEDEAIAVQILADETVFPELSDWRINTYNQHTDFYCSFDELLVNFTNQSVNYDTLTWDFGDGSTSVEENPSHTYEIAGDYVVTLTTYRNDCDESFSKSFNVETIGITDNNLDKVWSIYPNPSGEFINIEINNDKEYLFEIMDTNAKVVFRFNNKVKNITNLSNGIYFIKIIDTDTQLYSIKKWIKK